MKYHVPKVKNYLAYQKPEVTSSPILARLGMSRAIIMNPLIFNQPAGGSYPPGPAIAPPNNWLVFDTARLNVQELSGYTVPAKAREQVETALSMGQKIAKAAQYQPTAINPARFPSSNLAVQNAIAQEQQQVASVAQPSQLQPQVATQVPYQKQMPVPDMTVYPAPSNQAPVPSYAQVGGAPPTVPTGPSYAQSQGCVNCGGSRSQPPTGVQLTPLSIVDRVKGMLDKQLLPSSPANAAQQPGVRTIICENGWCHS